MNIYAIAAILFIVTVIMLQAAYYSYQMITNPDRAAIRRKLKRIALREERQEVSEITRKLVLSEIKTFNSILLRFSPAHQLNRLLLQANARRSAGFFILLSVLLFMSFYLLVSLKYSTLPAFGAGLAGGLSPFVYLSRQKKKRSAKFMRQLPEALDLIARSLRAGHAFSTGMQLAAEEFEDPLGPEFETTLDEINFGVGVPEALRKMTERVECKDLNFFVVAVILQRETGGNLAEIIDKIATLIRERFKLFGKVKALAAEAVLSMYVLLILPFFIGIVIYFLNPDYMSVMFEETIGWFLLGGASIMMIFGAIVMKNMVKIKV
ncbi:type II secretion system F family protein [Desulfonatronum lacustre]|uniref:type II secretion system F family protein n=1 Tax=Desulfonatronum lacustre TaxID=66849 RepID=UPI00048CA8ED|nr:type II secretion system F family protein [Desulfonatronum lacustre]